MRVMHTPGPWRYWAPDDEHYAYVDGPEMDEDHFENPDDARLIASAPELLEACEQSLKEHTEPSPPGTWDDTVDMLKTAIAKARGESEAPPTRERAEGASR